MVDCPPGRAPASSIKNGRRHLISYAQNFEDVMLARVFADRKDGFYVDVGAADPINLSVTKWFYDLGWNGLNIEPNARLFERLAADRPRDINLNCGAGAAESQAEFLESEVGELSSFDPRIHSTARAEATKGSTRTVTVFPLTTLLDQHCPQRPIDFLKIDVEGWELEVLKGLDLGKYRPTVIVVEATIPQRNIESHAEWEPLVLGAGYSFVYFDGVNRFYLAHESAGQKKHFNAPPNAFDDFEPFSLLRARTDAEQRLQAMNTLEQLVREKEKVIGEREIAIQERERTIQEKERVIQAKEAVIQEKETTIQEKEAVIGEKETMIEDRDAVIREKEIAIREKEADIQAKETMIRQKEAVIEMKETTIREKQAVIDEMVNSLAWRLTHPRWRSASHPRTTQAPGK